MRANELAKLVFRHDGLALEAQMVMSIELAGQPTLNHAEKAEDRQRRDRAKDGRHPEADTD